MLRSKRIAVGVLIGLWVGAAAAQAALVSLYPVDATVQEATRRPGDWRAQKFNPTTSQN